MFPILNESSSKFGQYSVQKHITTEIQQNLLELSTFILCYHPNQIACLHDSVFNALQIF